MYKKKQRQDLAFKTSEYAARQNERQDPAFKANEMVHVYQRGSKQSARQDPAFKANEIIYQRESKQNAR